MANQALRCRTISLKVWRAVRGAPAGTSKGNMGHGICDHISRAITLACVSSDRTEGLRQLGSNRTPCAGWGIAGVWIQGSFVVSCVAGSHPHCRWLPSMIRGWLMAS